MQLWNGNVGLLHVFICNFDDVVVTTCLMVSRDWMIQIGIMWDCFWKSCMKDMSSSFSFTSDYPTSRSCVLLDYTTFLWYYAIICLILLETVFYLRCRFLKMDRTQQETLAEQEALLAECKLYKGEKEPETKNAPVKNDGEEEATTGVPVGPASTVVVGAPVSRTTPWSTGLFACLGTGDEHFSSDLEVCKYCSLFFWEFSFLGN